MLEKLQYSLQAAAKRMLSRDFLLSTAIVAISTSLSVLISTYVTTEFLSIYPASKLSYYYFTQSIIFMMITIATQHVMTVKPKQFCLYTQIVSVIIILLYLLIGHLWHGITLFYCALLATASGICSLIAWNFIAWAYSMREFKENSSWFGSLGTLTGILMGYSLPLIIHNFGINSLTYLMIGLLVLFIIPTLMLDISLNTSLPKTRKTGDLGQYAIYKYLVIYTVVLLIAVTLIDFVVKGTISQTNNSSKIASYMATLYATSNVFVLLAQLMLMKPCLRWFGPAGILFILPAVLLFSTISYLFHPGLITATIMFVSNLSIYYSLNNLSREIVLNVMPPMIRAKGKAIIKGVASTFGAVIGATTIYLTMKFFGLDSNVIIIFLLAIVMLVMAFKLKFFYKQSLKDQLLLKRFTLDELISGVQSPTVYQGILQSSIRSMDPGLNLLGLSILEKEHPSELPKEIKEWLKNGNDDIFFATLRLCQHVKDATVIPLLQARLDTSTDEKAMVEILQALYFQDPLIAKMYAKNYIHSTTPKLRAYSAYVLLQKGNFYEVSEAVQLLNKFIASDKPIERAEVAHLLGEINVGNLKEEIIELIQDKSDIVSINAVYSAAKIPDSDLAKQVITQISRQQVAYHIVKLANRFGDILLPYLVEKLHSTANLKEIVFLTKTLCHIDSVQAENTVIDLLSEENFFISYHLAKNFAYQHLDKRIHVKNQSRIIQIIYSYQNYIHTLASAPHNIVEFLQKEITVRLYWAKKCYLYLLATLGNTHEIVPIIPVVSHALQEGNLRHFNTAIELIDACLINSEQKIMLSNIFDATIIENKELNIESIAKQDSWLTRMFEYSTKRVKGEKMDQLEKVIVLRNCSLFKDLPGESLLAIAAETQTISFAAGDTIYKEGDFPEGLFIISSGEVELTRDNKKLLSLKEYQFIGFMGVIQNSPYYATAKAIQPCEMLYLDKVTFDRILEDLPDVLLSFTHVLATYLSKILEKNRLYFS